MMSTIILLFKYINQEKAV